MKWYRDQGEDGLKLRPHPGPESKLTPLQEDQVCLWLASDATDFGFRTNLWTSTLIPVEMLLSHLKFGHCVNLIPKDLNHLEDKASTSSSPPSSTRNDCNPTGSKHPSIAP